MNNRWKRWIKRFHDGPSQLGRRLESRREYRPEVWYAGRWLYAWAVSHLGLPDGFLILLSALLAVYILESGGLPNQVLSFGLASLLMVNFIVGLFCCPKVDVIRRIPATATAEAEIEIGYKVRNRRSKPAWSLELDTLPWPIGLRLVNTPPVVTTLDPGQQLRLEAKLCAERRGRYLLPAIRCDSGFPFHLWRWGCNRYTGRQTLVVHPAFTPLTRIDMAFGLRYQPGGTALVSKVGPSTEFIGCRPFCQGDNIRHIHWRSWARTGTPVVREYQEEHLCRTALILDTHLAWQFGSRKVLPETFEAAVSLTAACTEYLTRSDYVVELFAAGPELYHFQGGRSLASFNVILDVLSCLDPHSGEPLDIIEPALMTELVRISSVLIILVKWDQRRAQLIERLVEMGVAVKPVLVSADTRRWSALPSYVTVWSPEEIAKGRCLSL